MYISTFVKTWKKTSANQICCIEITRSHFHFKRKEISHIDKYFDNALISEIKLDSSHHCIMVFSCNIKNRWEADAHFVHAGAIQKNYSILNWFSNRRLQLDDDNNDISRQWCPCYVIVTCMCNEICLVSHASLNRLNNWEARMQTAGWRYRGYIRLTSGLGLSWHSLGKGDLVLPWEQLCL